MTDNELLLAMSDLMDAKLKSELQPLKDDIRNIKLHIENVTDKNIQLLAENYVSAAKRFEKTSARIDAMEEDIALLKKVVAGHSEKLQKLA